MININSARGFTLSECLVVIALISILTLICFPYISDIWESVQADFAKKEILQAINYAREEAMVRGEKIALILKEGYLSIFLQKKEGDHMMLSKKISSKEAIFCRVFPHHLSSFVFTPYGVTDAENGSFWYCDKRGVVRWAIVVNKGGRAQESSHVLEYTC